MSAAFLAIPGLFYLHGEHGTGWRQVIRETLAHGRRRNPTGSEHGKGTPARCGAFPGNNKPVFGAKSAHSEVLLQQLRISLSAAPGHP